MAQTNNTFGKGINLDIPNYQYQADTLSYCRNCAFLTGEGNEGILQNIKGNILKDNLTPNYFPVAIKVYGGIAYIVSAEVENNTFTGRGEIGTFPSPDYENTTLKNGRTLQGVIDYQNPIYRPLVNYLKEDLDKDSTEVLNEELEVYGTSLSVYTKFNSKLFNFTEFTEFDIELQPSYDGSINIIFTDNYNPIRLINSRFTALPNNKFEIRDRIGQDDTNLYNKENFNNTLNLFQNSNKIVNLDLDSISFGGELNSGVYRYYIKYSTQDGNTTNIVAESFNVSVFHGTTMTDAKGGDSNILKNTRKQVRLKLTNLDTSYSLIKVQYSYSSGDNILNTDYYEIENNFFISGGDITIDHTGRESVFPISRQEIGIDYVTAFTAKTLTQNNNRLYVANVKSKQYNLVAFEEYASNIKIGHKQKRIEIPFTSAVVDDNSIYNSNLTTKIENTTDNLSIGFKNGYHNPYNIYYNVGYFPGEKYIFSCRFILDDGTTSQNFPLRGIDNWENNKYFAYGNEELNEANEYFSTVNGENLKGLYRFPYRDDSSAFANLNGDTSYSIIDSSTNINREVDTLGDGKLVAETSAFIFTDSVLNINTETLQNYYFNQLNGGANQVFTEAQLDDFQDPESVNFYFDDVLTYQISNCIADPNCELTAEVLECLNNPNCVVSGLRHNCTFIEQDAGNTFPFGQLYEISGVVCESSDEFNNTSYTINTTTSNLLDNYGEPLGTIYNYQVISTKDAQSNILAVTFELPDIEFPEGTIGIQFMRSVSNSKDSISQGYLVDTLPVPSIDIYGREEKGNRYIDYLNDFSNGGMKLVPAIDYILESPSVWDRSARYKRYGEGDFSGLQPILFNNRGWEETKPYDVRTKFAFISNDLLCSSYNLASDLNGGNFKLKEISKIGLYTSVRTATRKHTDLNVNNEYFSLFKTITIESSEKRTIDCDLDWVLANVDGRTPNGFSSRCFFSATQSGSKYNDFVIFPLKFNSYIGVSTKQEINLGEFSTSLLNGRIGSNATAEPTYRGKTEPSHGVVRPVAMLVSLYRDLGFELGTNEDDLSRIKSLTNLEAISYTPITKRLYWVKPEENEKNIGVEDISENGRILAYQGDNFVGLGIRQIFNNIYGLNDEAPEESFTTGRVGYSLSLVNDSIYNPLYRTIEVPNQAEEPLNYYPNLLGSSPNSIGNKYAQGNQWRDYENLESQAFNYGALKTYTDRNYITIVGQVPFLNTQFSTRVIYSELHINSGIENSFRNFLPSAYRDYSEEHGQITALRSAPTNSNFLVMVQETGIAMLPTNLRSILANQSNSTNGSLYFEENGILGSIEQIQQLTKQFGSKWLNSIVVTNGAVYGVDIDNTKIWKLSQGIEFISDMRVRSWLTQLKENYTYTSVNLLNKDIYAYFDLGNNYVHFNFKEVECINSTISTKPYAWEVDYTTLVEYNNGLLTGNEKPNVITDQDFIPKTIVEQEESPCPFVDEVPFPLDVDIFVIWDTTSFNPSLKSTLKTNVVYPWLNNFRNTYPQWVGNFYEIDSPNTLLGEQWLNWVTYVRAQPSPKAILIAMVDESHDSYHNENVPSGWARPEDPWYNGYSFNDANNNFTNALSEIGTTKPQAKYAADYKRFLDLYNNYFEYFKGIVYAIPSAPNDLPSLFTNFQLHAYAAIEGEVVSPANFIGSQQGNINIIKNENLYSELGLGLKHYGWQEQHNFSGQATDLTLAKFTEDITPLILQGTVDGFTGWKVKLSSGECTPLYKTECKETIPILTQNLSYSETLSSWNSFWGFYPSKTFNIFNKHYTFDGTFNSDFSQIWEHEINNTRCNFYGSQDEFIFEFLVTDNIQYQKIFNNFLVLCNEVPPIHIEYTTDNELTIDDVGVNPIKVPRVQDIYPRFRGRNFNPYNDNNQGNPVLNKVVKYNAKYKENHMYIQIDDNNRDTKGRLPNSPYSKINNSKIRDKYVKVRFRYKGDEYSIIQAIITAYEISFS